MQNAINAQVFRAIVKEDYNMGIASLVLGILSTGFCWCLYGNINWICAVMGITGIVLGSIARKQRQKCAVAGLALSIVGSVLSTILFVACASLVGGALLLY